ncbi:hypothetical protein BC939DRAFT_204223 [Gamsiella multidivaricata]|uniref:uncharacterized protein n=1 Tax=Gamsiella multidivaricata TaxID=101098 RepID=UPI00221F1C54|nr:uncharacterized protein BC939DRAFT_204223 [Gamsiella multidivaricata]KAI7821506.1 hypothetical protein BC939DRAFT_204223 [Gamsiella multidivaricata]
MLSSLLRCRDPHSTQLNHCWFEDLLPPSYRPSVRPCYLAEYKKAKQDPSPAIQLPPFLLPSLLFFFPLHICACLLYQAHPIPPLSRLRSKSITKQPPLLCTLSTLSHSHPLTLSPSHTLPLTRTRTHTHTFTSSHIHPTFANMTLFHSLPRITTTQLANSGHLYRSQPYSASSPSSARPTLNPPYYSAPPTSNPSSSFSSVAPRTASATSMPMGSKKVKEEPT